MQVKLEWIEGEFHFIFISHWLDIMVLNSQIQKWAYLHLKYTATSVNSALFLYNLHIQVIHIHVRTREPPRVKEQTPTEKLYRTVQANFGSAEASSTCSSPILAAANPEASIS